MNFVWKRETSEHLGKSSSALRAPRSTRRYTPVLPLDPHKTVEEQFGFVPLSVITPEKADKIRWKDAYLPADVRETRRSANAKYLPSLRFSEFHAGLCQDILRFWSPKNAKIVDPFAGRVTRAFVAASLGHQYTGYEISPKTAVRAREHLAKHGLIAIIHEASGVDMSKTPDESCDMSLTCPPYHSLEKYEDVPSQLSRIRKYEDFLLEIRKCAENEFRVLKRGGFAVWVVGDWREKGQLRMFHLDCINSFVSAGFQVWDIAIAKNNSPFAALQMGKVAAKRYTCKIHEYVLVFRKPDGSGCKPNHRSATPAAIGKRRNGLPLRDKILKVLCAKQRVTMRSLRIYTHAGIDEIRMELDKMLAEGDVTAKNASSTNRNRAVITIYERSR